MTTSEARGSWGKSVVAVLAGLVAVFVLSLGTDQILHMLQIYPPWKEPMWNPKLNLLALAYRCVYGVIGSYIAARLAPRRPMKHAMVLAGIGFFLCILGTYFAIAAKVAGPLWYPIALTVTALPSGWLGGWWAERRNV